MDNIWSNIEHKTYLSVLIESIQENQPLNKNDIELLHLLIKKFMTTPVTNETVEWLVKVINDFILVYFFDVVDTNIHGEISKTLLDIVKTVCLLQDVCMLVLEKLCKELQDCLQELQNDKNEDCPSLKITMIMMQIIFDIIKQNQFSINDLLIKEKLMKQSIGLLQLEEISDRNFLIANHILGVVLDIDKESHQHVLLSSLDKLHEQKDFKKLLLLLALQSVPMAKSNFIEKKLFWVILQDSLVCAEPLARKRSLYIIKCVLEVISTKEEFQSELAENTPIISWKGKENTELWKIWKTYALLCETFEEKQMHVINPVLPLLNDMVKATGEHKLHYSWVLVLVNRAMQHESKLLNTWAIHYCLHLDLVSFPMLSQPNWTFIFKTLFESLKNIFLYTKDEGSDVGSSPNICALLEKFFKLCFMMLDPSKQLLFWRQILTTFSSSTFNELALVYITKSLSGQQMSIELQNEDVLMLKDFLITKFPLSKVEYQILIFQHFSQFYCKNLTINDEKLDVLISLISHAYGVGILKLDRNCWKLWRNMITLDVEDIYCSKLDVYLKGSGSCKDLIIMLHLLLEANSSKDGAGLLQSVTHVIKKLPTSPYMNTKTILNSLEFVHMILELLSQKLVQSSRSFVDLVYSYAPPVLQYLNNLAKGEVFTLEPIMLEILENCFAVLENYTKLAIHLVDIGNLLKSSLTNYFSNSLINSASNGLSRLFKNQNDMAAQMHGLVCFKLLKLALSWFEYIDTVAAVTDVDKLFIQIFNLITAYARKELAVLQKKDNSSTTLNCDAFIVNCWDCMGILIKQQRLQKLVEEKQQIELLDAFQTDLTIVSNRILAKLAGFAKHFVGIFQGNTDQLLILVDVMWKLLRNQLHSDQTFRDIYKRCIEVFFHQDLLDSTDEKIVAKVNESWQKILELGETKPIVTNIAVEYFLNVWNSLLSKGSLNVLNYVDPLVRIAVFGPLRQKREKPYNNLYSYVMQNTQQYDDVENLKCFQSLDQSVRITFINFILNLPKINNQQAVDSLVTSLVRNFVSYEQRMSNKCYYPNSEHHRKKLRAWQIILVLLPQLPKDFEYTDLLQQMFVTCKSDNQPSIRYLAEWAIILVLLKDKNLVGNLWADLERSTEKKILSVTFILSIAIQLSKILNDEDFVDFANSAVPKILPWAHAHHMTSRIHSQIALQNIWDRIRMMDNSNPSTALLKEKFSFLEFCFSLKVNNSAGVKHKQELMRSFFYTIFHATEDYNLKFIFETFSRHHKVSSDEWLDVKHFHFIETKSSILRRLRVFKEEREEEKKETTVSDDERNAAYTDIQKKIMPWNLAPSDDLVLQSELSRKRDLGTSDLILCAVLVEKIPNMGGLCRTAEIFGAKQLLIASNRYVSDPGFRSLSVTSEKWIDIEQVLPIKLGGYLSEKKSEGYTIVGVEQTANSQMIGKFNFPKKTVLVLGNEKTGIPVELIQILDECVEIPQVGIIRSLNVHISGAIMVWEYCKQHLL